MQTCLVYLLSHVSAYVLVIQKTEVRHSNAMLVKTWKHDITVTNRPRLPEHYLQLPIKFISYTYG